MLSVFNSEFYKLCKRRGNWIIVLITCICGFLIGGISLASLDVNTEMRQEWVNSWFYIQGSNIYNIFFVLTIILAAMFFALEYNENTLKSVLFRGTPRGYVFFSKFILNILMVFFLHVLFVLCGSITVGMRNGWEFLVPTKIVKSGFIFAGKMSLIMIAYTSIFIMVGIVSKNLIITIGLSYGVRILEAIVVLMCRGISGFGWIEKKVIANYDFYLFSDFSEEVVRQMIFCVAITIFFMAVSLITFCKQDIKN